MNVGSVAALWRYPVKSLLGESLAEACIEDDGIPGDRAKALVVRSEHARNGKAYRGKEDRRLHRIASAELAMQRASERGVLLETLPAPDGHDYDDAPLSVIFDRWIDEVGSALGMQLEYERFRPNVFVRTAIGAVENEATLVGRVLQLGAARLRVREPIGRCVTISYDIDGEGTEPSILAYIANKRDNVMGIYCDVLRAGIVRTGDALVLEER